MRGPVSVKKFIAVSITTRDENWWWGGCLIGSGWGNCKSETDFFWKILKGTCRHYSWSWVSQIWRNCMPDSNSHMSINDKKNHIIFGSLCISAYKKNWIDLHWIWVYYSAMSFFVWEVSNFAKKKNWMVKLPLVNSIKKNI